MDALAISIFSLQGTSADQDNRFSDKEKKLLRQMKFEESLNTKIDLSRVKMDVMKPWIAKRVADFLGIEDDVVVEFIFNQLEDNKNVDPRIMQINLTGFLNGKNARVFMGELWRMLDSAQKNESGIPQELLDQKKEEIRGRRENDDRLQESLRRLAEDNNTGGDSHGGGFARRNRRSRSRDKSRRSVSRERRRGSRER